KPAEALDRARHPLQLRCGCDDRAYLLVHLRGERNDENDRARAPVALDRLVHDEVHRAEIAGREQELPAEHEYRRHEVRVHEPVGGLLPELLLAAADFTGQAEEAELLAGFGVDREREQVARAPDRLGLLDAYPLHVARRPAAADERRD